MKRTTYGLAGMGLALLAAGMAASAQNEANQPKAVDAQTAAEPIQHLTFERTMGEWVASGENAKLSVTTEPGQAKEGMGALKYDYTLKKGELGFMALPTPSQSLAKMKSLRFWAKADYATTLMVVMQETGGGRYVASVVVPAGAWQQIALSPSDFALATDVNDPKDPDGKLDMDAVESIGVADLGQFFAQIDDANMSKLLNVHTGPHTLLLDDWTIGADALPDNFAMTGGEGTFDKFARPQLNWAVLGDMKATVAKGKPLGGTGVMAEYKQQPERIVGLVKGLPLKSLVGAKTLRFTAASKNFAKVLVQVEEVGGGKYNVLRDIKAGGEPNEYEVTLSELIAGDDSKDTNHKLDLDQVNKLLILDLTPFYDPTPRDNTLWIGSVRTTTK